MNNWLTFLKFIVGHFYPGSGSTFRLCCCCTYLLHVANFRRHKAENSFIINHLGWSWWVFPFPVELVKFNWVELFTLWQLMDWHANLAERSSHEARKSKPNSQWTAVHLVSPRVILLLVTPKKKSSSIYTYDLALTWSRPLSLVSQSWRPRPRGRPAPWWRRVRPALGSGPESWEKIGAKIIEDRYETEKRLKARKYLNLLIWLLFSYFYKAHCITQ